MVNNIYKINELIRNNPNGFVDGVENEYHNRIKDIAKKINDNSNIKIMLLAGPSASGKTTGAHILRDYLIEMGHRTEIISLDDFFKPHERMPLDEFGNMDFESVHSLETEEIKECFNNLLQENQAELPIFNFHTKRRENHKRKITLGDNDLVIVEGLHALHPLIADGLPQASLLRLYVSVVGCYVDNAGRRLIDSRNIRLMRRLSRDMIYRNSPPERSLDLWSSVVRGEDKYLCPHRHTAEIELISFHDYELCVFKGIMYDILNNLPETVENYNCVKAIINAMNCAETLDINYVPENSLIREFMRGGKYE